MEFLLGVAVTFASILFVRRFIINDKIESDSAPGKLVYRQSHIVNLLGPELVQLMTGISPRSSQSRDYYKRNSIRIVFSGDKAYWIKDNTFFEANQVNGQVDDSTTKVVDTMTMDKVELDKMIFIVQKLTEGTANDGRNPGI